MAGLRVLAVCITALLAVGVYVGPNLGLVKAWLPMLKRLFPSLRSLAKVRYRWQEALIMRGDISALC